MSLIEFDSFEINLDLLALSHDGAIIEIGAKPLRALIFLIENRHRVVDLEMLREHVWSDAQLSAAAIPTAIMSIRRALGDDPGAPRYIQSQRGRGYRFIADIRRTSTGASKSNRGLVVDRLPFVGRHAAVAHLNKRVRRIRASRRGELILISAEAGIGKTRLLHEFCKQTPENVATYSTRTAPIDGTPAFWPWAQLLSTAMSQSRPPAELGQHTQALANAIPELASLDLQTQQPTSPTNEFNVFRRWTNAIYALTCDGPAIVTIDDIHRLDNDSLTLLYWLADEISDHPLLIVATSRPNLQSESAVEVVRDLSDLSSVSRIELPALSSDDVRAFLDPLVHDVNSLPDSLHARTGGNAFYLTHLLRCLEANPNLDLDGEHFDGLPLHAREIVARQLSDLPEITRQALSAASVLGNRFQVEALASSIDLPIERAADAIEPAIDAWILSEEMGEYAFNHQLLRESLYRVLPTSSRKALHLRAANTLSTSDIAMQCHASEIAHHRLSALPLGNAREAAQSVVRAARLAAQRRAYSEARRLFEQALAIERSISPQAPVEQQTTLIELAHATLYCGNRARSSELLEEASRIARQIGDRKALATCALSLAPDFLTIEVGGWEPSLIQLLEEALAKIGETDQELRGILLARLSIANQWNPSCDNRAQLARAALEIAGSLDSDKVRLAALAAAVETLNGPSRADERLEKSRELGQVARRLGNTPEILLHHTRSIAALLELGDITGVESENKLHAQLSAQIDLPQFRWLSLATESMLAALRGDLSAADSISKQYIEVAQNHIDANVVLTYGGQELLRNFERDVPGRSIDAIDRIGLEYPSVRFWRALGGWVKFVAGNIDESRAVLSSFTEEDLLAISSEPGGGLGLASLAEVAADVGSETQRRSILELTTGLETRCVVAGYGVAYAGGFSRHIALLERSLSRVDSALDLLESAVRGELKRGAPSWAMYALADLIDTQQHARMTPKESIAEARSLLQAPIGLQLPRATRVLQESCQRAENHATRS